jgi:hypothetical protein
MNKPEKSHANDAEGSDEKKKDRKNKKKCRQEDKSKTITIGRG